jgi:hypothetical protein
MNENQIIEDMGFVICEFPPDQDPCESCKQPMKQLYFKGPTDAGRYLCKECIIEEYNQNVFDLEENLRIENEYNLMSSTQMKVTFIGCSEEQHRFGNNTGNLAELTIGAEYDVIAQKIHCWHTQYYLKYHKGSFNSVGFVEKE